MFYVWESRKSQCAVAVFARVMVVVVVVVTEGPADLVHIIQGYGHLPSATAVNTSRCGREEGVARHGKTHLLHRSISRVQDYYHSRCYRCVEWHDISDTSIISSFQS